MNAEIFAEWMRRQGYRVFRTAGSYWHETGLRVLQAFPYHRLIHPEEEELAVLLRSVPAVGLRYSSDMNASWGLPSYHVVYTSREYALSDLSRKARYDVKKGEKVARVEPISFDRLAGEGWILRSETLVRQGRAGAEKRQWWVRLCRSAMGLPGLETWGALVDGVLASALIAFTCDDCCSILYQMSRTDYLKMAINPVLTYFFTREALRRPEVDWVFYGLHSLDAPPSVDEYKFRMGFSARPVRQRVVFHPVLSGVFTPTAHVALRKLSRAFPSRHVLSKAEGMVRFYLEGRQRGMATAE